MAQKMNPLEDNLEDRLKITVVGKNLPVTDALKQHVMDRIERVEQVTPQVIEVIVYLEVQKLMHHVEILYKFSHFKVVTNGTAQDMYQALHVAIGRLRRKLRKWKTRIQDHHAKNLSEVEEMSVQVLDKETEEIEEINDEIDEENFAQIEQNLAPPTIKKRKKRPLKTLTLEEAVMKLELREDHFMVYRSEEDQKLKVIYVRRDRSLGILEIE